MFRVLKKIFWVLFWTVGGSIAWSAVSLGLWLGWPATFWAHPAVWSTPVIWGAGVGALCALLVSAFHLFEE